MNRWRPRILVLLAVTSIYLYGFPSATLTYSGVLLFHLGAGLVLTILMVPYFVNCWRVKKVGSLAVVGFLVVRAGLGVLVDELGEALRLQKWLSAPLLLVVAGV